MSRLIDADALNMDIMGRLTIVSPDVAKYANGVMSLIAHAPTIEAEPVRHGEWKPYQTPIETRQIGWICTCCSGVVHDVSNGDTNYCPNCGARMGGDSHD